MQDVVQKSSLEEATSRYQQSLDERVRSYLSERGIDESAVLSSRLGLCVDPAPGHEQFRGRLTIPYLSAAGVRTIKARCLEDHVCTDVGCPKYLGIAGARGFMFNPSALLVAGEVVAVCEGELDAIVCTEVVGIPAVGVPGVSAWKPHFPRMFSGIPRVICVIDNDEKQDGRNPGRELGERISRDLEQAVVITPPPGEDLSSWCLQVGPEAIRKAAGLT
jgi:DNA primase